ncbi:hypothetical protein GWK10_06415 [Spongiivirga citrea]|uniref:TerB family tellurite resistance protein n=2 Tax=Spongiivirga citrea TaxID=1481457 RepID=A0A6M0CG67_9FLAO|nr:hypothetical protein [Spongiivirga citrea]
MSITEKPEILFYQNLGQLFYAIAAADKVVRKAEYDALKKIVLDYWKDYEEAQDAYDEPVAYQMEIVFEWFDYESMDAQDCFDSFSEYAHEHPRAFSKEKRILIVKTAEAIANSFAGKNKSELIMLTKLKMLFRKLSSQ